MLPCDISDVQIGILDSLTTPEIVCSAEGAPPQELTELTSLHYCLSDDMHGQNINLPVCVSVTLSVNSPTGQTHQRIFTVDSLKDADLREDVPIRGLDDE